MFQIILSAAPKNWQNGIINTIQNGILVDRERNIRTAHPDKMIFEQKIQFLAFFPKSIYFPTILL